MLPPPVFAGTPRLRVGVVVTFVCLFVRSFVVVVALPFLLFWLFSWFCSFHFLTAHCPACRYRTTEDGTTVAASPVGAKKQSSWLNRAKSAMRGAEKLANTAITRASAALDEAQRRRRLGNTQVTGISLNDIVLSPFKCAHANLDSVRGASVKLRVSGAVVWVVFAGLT